MDKIAIFSIILVFLEDEHNWNLGGYVANIGQRFALEGHDFTMDSVPDMIQQIPGVNE